MAESSKRTRDGRCTSILLTPEERPQAFVARQLPGLCSMPDVVFGLRAPSGGLRTRASDLAPESARDGALS
jgi:hypothetical protein